MISVVDRERLEEVADSRPSGPAQQGHETPERGFDLDRWISDRGIEVVREGPWKNGGYKWVLGKCPWNGHTDKSAFIVRWPNDVIGAGCKHNSCQGYGWRDLREHYEPGCYGSRGPEFTRPGAAQEQISSSKPGWPRLSEEAYYGLAGDIVRTIEPSTEADPVGLLVTLLGAVGNAIGRGSYLVVGSDTHYLKLFVTLVGETSKARKGVSWGAVKQIVTPADPEWANACIASGLSSGEGLIYRVRDLEGAYEEGEGPVIEGGEDKRLFVVEPEMAQVLKITVRQGNTVSSMIRQAWDDSRLQTLTRTNPLRATRSHISILGHVTKSELVRHLTETDMANGFANRFLWISVERSRILPFPEAIEYGRLKPLVDRLREVIEFGKRAGQITWGDSGEACYRAVYGPLSEGKPGLFGSVTSRAEAQMVRLAAIHAVMALSTTIEGEHLMAALAIWQYAEDSARYIFGDATGDPDADQILAALRGGSTTGMTRTEIWDLFQRNKDAARIGQAIELLVGAGHIWRKQEHTGGRPTERYFAR